MKRSSVAAVALVLALAINVSVARADGLQDDVDQAVSILERFQSMPEEAIPDAVFRNAEGLAIITVLKAGFILSGRGGTGIVVARTEDGWSGPSAIATGGAGWGFQAGAQVSEFVILLNTAAAVSAFSRGGNFALGTDLSAAAGPVGRSIGADFTPMAAVYTYSRSQGLFAGISLEGAVLGARYEANRNYYGREVTPAEILSGKVNPPAGAERLLAILGQHTNKAKGSTVTRGRPPAGRGESAVPATGPAGASGERAPLPGETAATPAEPLTAPAEQETILEESNPAPR